MALSAAKKGNSSLQQHHSPPSEARGTDVRGSRDHSVSQGQVSSSSLPSVFFTVSTMFFLMVTKWLPLFQASHIDLARSSQSRLAFLPQ